MRTTRSRAAGRLAGAALTAGLIATMTLGVSAPALAAPAPAAEATATETAAAASAWDGTRIFPNLPRCLDARRDYSTWAWVSNCYWLGGPENTLWAFDFTCRIC